MTVELHPVTRGVEESRALPGRRANRRTRRVAKPPHLDESIGTIAKRAYRFDSARLPRDIRGDLTRQWRSRGWGCPRGGPLDPIRGGQMGVKEG